MNPTRRGLLACATPVLAIAWSAPTRPALSAEHPDAALLAVCTTFATLTASMDRMNADPTVADADLEATCCHWHEAVNELSDLRAVTAAGVQAKARAVIAAFRLDVPTGVDETVESSAEPHELAAWSLLQDLVAGAGGIA